MGLSGFKEVKTVLMKESIMAEKEELEIEKSLTFNISPKEKFIDIPMKVISASIRQMEDTLKNLSVFELMKDVYKRQDSEKDKHMGHLVLLAENNKGYRNLMKIVSEGYRHGFYYKPRIDKNLSLIHIWYRCRHI